MSNEYRRAPAGPPDDVVEYRPMGKVIPWIAAFAVVAFGLAVLLGILDATRSTDVTCGHAEGGGSCILTTNDPLLGESSRIVPLRKILGTDLRRTTSKGTSYYRVILVTDEGEVPLSSHSSKDGAARQAVKRTLDAFLADAQHPSIVIHYDVGSRAVLWVLLLELLPFYIVWLVFQRVRVVFDWREKRVRLVRTRWPFRPWVRAFAFDRIVRAVLQAKPGSKGAVNYSVALELDDGEQQKLSRMTSTSPKHHEATIAQLDALLARREPRRPTDS